MTPPPRIAPKPIPIYKEDALKDRIIDACLGFNEIRYAFSAGFIPKPGIPHNRQTKPTRTTDNGDGFNKVSKEKAANKIAKPKSDNLSVVAAPIRSVKYPPARLPNKAPTPSISRKKLYFR